MRLSPLRLILLAGVLGAPAVASADQLGFEPWGTSNTIVRSMNLPTATQASRLVLAKRLVTLINAGRCDKARRLVDNQGDFDMARHVAYHCAMARDRS